MVFPVDVDVPTIFVIITVIVFRKLVLPFHARLQMQLLRTRTTQRRNLRCSVTDARWGAAALLWQIWRRRHLDCGARTKNPSASAASKVRGAAVALSFVWKKVVVVLAGRRRRPTPTPNPRDRLRVTVASTHGLVFVSARDAPGIEPVIVVAQPRSHCQVRPAQENPGYPVHGVASSR